MASVPLTSERHPAPPPPPKATPFALQAQTTMPPGTYFIGDPCLVTEWAAVYEQVYGSEDGIVYIRDHKTVAFHTAAGDGKFLDNDEHRC